MADWDVVLKGLKDSGLKDELDQPVRGWSRAEQTLRMAKGTAAEFYTAVDERDRAREQARKAKRQIPRSSSERLCSVLVDLLQRAGPHPPAPTRAVGAYARDTALLALRVCVVTHRELGKAIDNLGWDLDEEVLFWLELARHAQRVVGRHNSVSTRDHRELSAIVEPREEPFDLFDWEAATPRLLDELQAHLHYMEYQGRKRRQLFLEFTRWRQRFEEAVFLEPQRAGTAAWVLGFLAEHFSPRLWPPPVKRNKRKASGAPKDDEAGEGPRPKPGIKDAPLYRATSLVMGLLGRPITPDGVKKAWAAHGGEVWGEFCPNPPKVSPKT